MYKYKCLQAGQLPRVHLPFLQNLLNFIIIKKQEVNDDLSVCMDKRSTCGLSIAGDTKIYQCHAIKMLLPPMTLVPQKCYYLQWKSVLWTSIKKLLLLPKFDLITVPPPGVEYLMERFE